MLRLLKSFGLALALTITSLSANDDLLISGEEAYKLLGKENVVFVSGDSHDIYEAIGHITGSVEMYAHHLHHADVMGGMHCAPLFMCPEDAEEYISSKGIKNDDLIIAYDDYRGPNATGVWAYFKSFGHKNIKILNGGMDAIRKLDPVQAEYDTLKDKEKEIKDQLKELKKAGKKKTPEYKELDKQAKEYKKQYNALVPDLKIQKGKPENIVKSHYKIDTSKIDMDFIVGKETIEHAMHDILEKKQDSKFRIIDTRAIAEIIGERKVDNVSRGGHVPGSTFLEWKQISDSDNRLSFKSKAEMQKVFDKYGITKDQTIYAYCHVGAGRSTEIIAALKMLGYENAKVYTGSWDEWGNAMSLPVRR
jgi:thiosulfate/3-mercaptopyruvate sulfurtransferase